jgi:hypothetical protein
LKAQLKDEAEAKKARDRALAKTTAVQASKTSLYTFKRR